MNKPRAEYITLTENPSSGSQIFKLKSITCKSKLNNINIQIDFSDFAQKFGGKFFNQILQTNKALTIAKIFDFQAGSKPIINELQCHSKESSKKLEELSQKNLAKQVNKQKIQTEAQNFLAPIPKFDRCLICKSNYENYFQHISTIVHQKKFNINNHQSKFYIAQIIDDLIKQIDKSNNKVENKKQDVQNQKRAKVYQEQGVHYNSEILKKKIVKRTTATSSSTLFDQNNQKKKQKQFI